MTGNDSGTGADVSATKIVSVRKKKVPTLYEQDESRYAGPHPWQIQPWAKALRRGLRWHAYTRWSNEAFTSVTVAGAEHLETLDEPCLFIGNHQSHLDTLLVMAALPEHVRRNLYLGAAQDRWYVRGRKKLVLQPWYQSLALGNFPILRGGGKRALAYAAWLLQQGQHVFLFPEGTRATSSALGEFKHGVSILALENGVPVVPMYLDGLKQLRPKGQRDVVKGAAHATILPPVRFAAGTAVAEATQRLYDLMSAVHHDRAGLDAAVRRAA
ncbi:MAG: 1-acyl-sn-glycerol-3-phosphate acyltransferase [Pseudomonadales bacterium]|nr:1-acyl-sn-glycerol-3-phosphate acyltransferase [Pseudomonadales bacterium]MCP5184518.1 1-acyl-sn-glycerol-3-phosphate acyltransferase [Pseudomonadales bacterium]